MASYTDLIQAAMQYQNLYLERRGTKAPAARVTDASFDKLLTRSIEKTATKGPVYTGASQSPISPEEVEDQLKFRECLKFVLSQEGSKYVSDDGGKEASRYGILQSTAKALGFKGDIRNISKGDVEKIYKKLWDKSGAKALAYPMALVHFDTFINSPAAAKRLLKRSDGDLEVYLDSREQRYTRLAEVRPQSYNKYLKGWKGRISSLKNVISEYKRLTVADAGPSRTDGTEGPA